MLANKIGKIIWILIWVNVTGYPGTYCSSPRRVNNYDRWRVMLLSGRRRSKREGEPTTTQACLGKKKNFDVMFSRKSCIRKGWGCYLLWSTLFNSPASGLIDS